MKGAGVPGTYWFGTYTVTRRVYGAGWLVVTIILAGSLGSAVPKVFGSRAMPGYIALSFDSIVNDTTFPRGVSSDGLSSGAGRWVGPTIKFPSTLAGAFVPSSSCFAVT